MNDSQDDLRQEIVLFRYGVIADLVYLPVGAPSTDAELHHFERGACWHCDALEPGSHDMAAATESRNRPKGLARFRDRR